MRITKEMQSLLYNYNYEPIKCIESLFLPRYRVNMYMIYMFHVYLLNTYKSLQGIMGDMYA